MTPELHCDAPWQTISLAAGCAIAAFAYLALSDAQGGRTLGKKWFSLRLCRRDGRDLGVLRALLRTIVLMPGVALLMPTLARAVIELLACAGLGQRANAGGLAGAGLAWLVALHLLGRMSPFGRPLQDALVGAWAWKAQRSAEVARVVPVSARLVSPGRALKLSIVPGLGIMYAGHLLLGLLFLAATIFALVNAKDARPGLAVWIGSALVAQSLAARRRRRDEAARDAAPTAADGGFVRRQES